MSVGALVHIRDYHLDTVTIVLADLPANWVGWTFAAQIREFRDDDAFLITTFTVDDTGLATDGEVIFTIPAATTATLPVDTQWWYDVRAKNGPVQHTFTAGTIGLTENVTVIP